MSLQKSALSFLVCQFILISASITVPVSTNAADLPYVNWENHPVHPLDISPSGDLLAVAHTADNRVQLFDISTGAPQAVGHVLVGVDPVSVRFRNNNELWVVNHISDSVSIVDINLRQVRATLLTADEPFDVVFAGTSGLAFVSCSQANKVLVYDPSALNQAPVEVAIDAEDPRAMATSPDGSKVYVAIFESGNATTILGAHNVTDEDPPNVVTAQGIGTPYDGESPPPNDGNQFTPAINPDLFTPPRSGLIVRKNADGRWMDDNEGDWTTWVSGDEAAESGRVPGWDMPDRDIAIIDAQTLAVSYVSGLMNIGMGLAVNPVSGDVTLIGTDASNQVRFEPNVKGRFLQVLSATVDAADLNSKIVSDLNPHLDYVEPTIAQSQRNKSLGDPRGIVWMTDGQRGYVAGMGSNSVIAIDPGGSRVDGIEPIAVGLGPIGLALNEMEGLLYVWNHFDASLTVISLDNHAKVSTTTVFSPLPEAIRKGRAQFYDTHETSGLGQIACASCHVDGRMDRLAWDLGSPAGDVKFFNQNCMTSLVNLPCAPFHPMKGPMLTQTLQDIIGHEPFHWRGDRDGLEEFNGAFSSLLGDDESLTDQEMQRFEDFLDTLTFPPNPFRNLNNSLPTDLALSGHVSSGRFSTAGTALPNGNAENGLLLFNEAILASLPTADGSSNCSGCHSLPTGMAPNSRAIDPIVNIALGGLTLPEGPNGENHLLITGISSLQSLTMKIPQLRNLYERTGYETKLQQSRAGFGFQHDGTVDSLAHYVSLTEFETESDQDVADLVAFLLAFSGSDLPTDNAVFAEKLEDSQDTHAAVGQQVTRSSSSAGARLNTLLNLAKAHQVEVIAHQADNSRPAAWLYDGIVETFEPDDNGAALTRDELLALASFSAPITFTAVPTGLGERLALDRDGDGIYNGTEIAQYSNPADPESTQFTPEPGLWYDPNRDGHGIDLQRSGNSMVATWYTYREDGTPHWYQSAGELQGMSWTGELYQATWNPAKNGIDIEVVGILTMNFDTAQSAEFNWTIGENSGSEMFSRFVFATGFTPQNYTGIWFDPDESGWGVSVDSLADTRVSLVFFYDANDQPRWVLGSGNNASGTEFEMLSFSGFCPWCETVETATVNGGTINLEFNGNRLADVEMAVDYPGVPGSLFEKNVAVVPLSNEDVNPLSF